VKEANVARGLQQHLSNVSTSLKDEQGQRNRLAVAFALLYRLLLFRSVALLKTLNYLKHLVIVSVLVIDDEGLSNNLQE